VIGAFALVGVTWAELPPRDYRESLLGAVESEADRLIVAGALDEALPWCVTSARRSLRTRGSSTKSR
jgi:hypothetical protein